jgi:hypothetical protein
MIATLALFTAAFEACETLEAAFQARCSEVNAIVEGKLGKLSSDASEAECDVYWDAQEDIEATLSNHPGDICKMMHEGRVDVAALLIETVKANPLATAEHFEGLDAQRIGHGHWTLVRNYAASVAKLAGLTS